MSFPISLRGAGPSVRLTRLYLTSTGLHFCEAAVPCHSRGKETRCQQLIPVFHSQEGMPFAPWRGFGFLMCPRQLLCRSHLLWLYLQLSYSGLFLFYIVDRSLSRKRSKSRGNRFSTGTKVLWFAVRYTGEFLFYFSRKPHKNLTESPTPYVIISSEQYTSVFLIVMSNIAANVSCIKYATDIASW